MKIDVVAHHRNGISGTPFSVGIVDEVVDGVAKKLFIVQFDNDKANTAVFDFDMLRYKEISFGINSWRGDNFADAFAKVAEN